MGQLAALGVALATVMSLALAADAHTTGTGLLVLTIAGSTLQYRLTLVPGELPEAAARLLVQASEGDRESAERLTSELRRRVVASVGDAPCRPEHAGVEGARSGDTRVRLDLTLVCASSSGRLVVREDWFDLFGEHYRTIARIETPAGAREAVFLPDTRTVTIDVGDTPSSSRLGFFRLGVEHILRGYDHLLFLAALLLPGGRLLSMLAIVTAFTLAHSVTLALAVLRVVTLPDRVVECAIALSIVWVALENVLLPRAPSRRWVVSFVFGLVHGFGFASTLLALDLPPRNMALALLGFNLGVETGQAVVVALLVPLLAWMRQWPWEPRMVRVASLAVAAIGLVWFVERLFV